MPVAKVHRIDHFLLRFGQNDRRWAGMERGQCIGFIRRQLGGLVQKPLGWDDAHEFGKKRSCAHKFLYKGRSRLVPYVLRSCLKR